MLFDELTEKDELEMACEADKLEESLLSTGKEDKEKLSEIKQDNCTNINDGAAKLEGKSSFTLSYKRGDLFTCPKTDSLVHCVSKDLRMGKGIAVRFKEKFGGIPELKQQANRVGDIAFLKRDDRFIYYLITKPKYHNKPTYHDLETTLRGMKHHCVKNGVKTLSMPKIGCGLDKLLWPQVEGILKKVFGDTDISISVYTF